jgi:hypothetical protein
MGLIPKTIARGDPFIIISRKEAFATCLEDVSGRFLVINKNLRRTTLGVMPCANLNKQHVKADVTIEVDMLHESDLPDHKCDEPSAM